MDTAEIAAAIDALPGRRAELMRAMIGSLLRAEAAYEAEDARLVEEVFRPWDAGLTNAEKTDLITLAPITAPQKAEPVG